MDAKDLRTRSTLCSDRNNDTSKYVQSGSTLQCDRNKTYQDIGSNPLAKVDTPSSRPCAVIGPDRVIPPPASNDAYLKKSAEPWPTTDDTYRRPPEYPHKLTSYLNPTRNISPRQTFQENMQRIMVPPTYHSAKISDESSYAQIPDRNSALLKNTKISVPAEPKYCDVPYSVNLNNNDQKNVRIPDMCVSSGNPAPSQTAPHGWPPMGGNLRPRAYAPPDLYQFQEYQSCAGPRPVVPRTHRMVPDESAYMYPDRYYQDGNIRFKPYPTLKERYPPRYEYLANYTNPFHPPPFPQHRYDLQKSIPPHFPPYAPVKYVDNRVLDPNMDVYQRNQVTNFNLPYRNPVIHPNYGAALGNYPPNKLHPYPSDNSVKTIPPNKISYDNSNKSFTDYENSHSRLYPPSDSYFVNEMGRVQPMKSQVIMPNYSNMNMQPPNPYYKKDNPQIKHYEYMSNFKNMDPNIHNLMSRHPMFSPNTLAISPTDSSTSNDTAQTLGNLQEDCGYVSQSSTTSIRSMDSGISRSLNDYYRRYYDPRSMHLARNSPMGKSELNSNNASKDKKQIDVRQFLQMWSEGDDETEESNSKKIVIKTGSGENNKLIKSQEVHNQEQLYVLGLVNVPCEELGKYEHIQKVSKLPENIKGYTNIELLNQFEEVIESSNMNSFKSPTPKDNFHMPIKGVASKQPMGLLPRPVSPLDVEAKISQSIIHKEVGCNFEIKPCSPKMLNVDIAAPVQNILAERAIEKVANPVMIKSPILHGITENLDYNMIQRQDNRLNNTESLRNSSCKMINTPFSNNNPDQLKNSYSLHDLESNSGLCLASLPRLDNDIELNFPEVNQQFINANRGEPSVITPLKDLPPLDETKSENKSVGLGLGHELKVNQLSSESEKEICKLSKYRKIRTNNIDSQEKSAAICKEDQTHHSSQVVHRTDSVIIKNPENTRNYDEISNDSPNWLNEANHSIQQGPINLTPSEKLTVNKIEKQDIVPITKKVKNQTFADVAIDFSLNKNDPSNKFSVSVEKETDGSACQTRENSSSCMVFNDLSSMLLSTTCGRHNIEKGNQTICNISENCFGNKYTHVDEITVQNSNSTNSELDSLVRSDMNNENNVVNTIKESDINSKHDTCLADTDNLSNRNNEKSANAFAVGEEDIVKKDVKSQHHIKENEYSTERKEINYDVKQINNEMSENQDYINEKDMIGNKNCGRERVEKIDELGVKTENDNRGNDKCREYKEKSSSVEIEAIQDIDKTSYVVENGQQPSDQYPEISRNGSDEIGSPEEDHDNNLKEVNQSERNHEDTFTRENNKVVQDEIFNGHSTNNENIRSQENEMETHAIECMNSRSDDLILADKNYHQEDIQINQNKIEICEALEKKTDEIEATKNSDTQESHLMPHKSKIENGKIDDIATICDYDIEDISIKRTCKIDENNTALLREISGDVEENNQNEQNSISLDVTYDFNKSDSVPQTLSVDNYKYHTLKDNIVDNCDSKSENNMGNSSGKPTAYLKEALDISVIEVPNDNQTKVEKTNMFDFFTSKCTYLKSTSWRKQLYSPFIKNLITFSEGKIASHILNTCKHKILKNTTNSKRSKLTKHRKERSKRLCDKDMSITETISAKDKGIDSKEVENLFDANQELLLDNNKPIKSLIVETDLVGSPFKNNNVLPIGNAQINSQNNQNTLGTVKNVCPPCDEIISPIINQGETNCVNIALPFDNLVETNNIDILGSVFNKDTIPIVETKSLINVQNYARKFEESFEFNKISVIDNNKELKYPTNVEKTLKKYGNSEGSSKIDNESSFDSNDICLQNSEKETGCLIDNKTIVAIFEEAVERNTDSVRSSTESNKISSFDSKEESQLQSNVEKNTVPTHEYFEMNNLPDVVSPIDSHDILSLKDYEKINSPVKSENSLCALHTCEESAQFNDINIVVSPRDTNKISSMLNNGEIISLKSKNEACTLEDTVATIGSQLLIDTSKVSLINNKEESRYLVDSKESTYLFDDTGANNHTNTVGFSCDSNKSFPVNKDIKFMENTNPTNLVESSNLLECAQLETQPEDMLLTEGEKITEQPSVCFGRAEKSSNKIKYTDNCNLINRRQTLKRSLSDSVLNFRSNIDDLKESNEENIQFIRPYKRRKVNDIESLDQEFITQNLCNIIQNNRRNSVASVYNEENVSFCILIDNNCIIAEEETDGSKICYTESSQDCVSDVQDEPENDNLQAMTTVETSPLANVDACDYSDSFTFNCENKILEDSWVEDIACVETVVSDDIAENIIISGPSSPKEDILDKDESEIFSCSGHTDKVKYIYGEKMCSDDAQYVDTLYNTPQMNVTKTLISRESQVFECHKYDDNLYYDRDSLEKILSESNGQEPSFTSEYMNSIAPIDEEDIINYKTPDDNEDVKIESSPASDVNIKDLDIDIELENIQPKHCDKTQDDTVHSCESSIDNVFSYKLHSKDEDKHYLTSNSPEVSSTTSEDKNSSILLKITNYKGSRISQINSANLVKDRPSCKFTEEKDYLNSNSTFPTKRPLLTKAAQKYIPPLEESICDLKVKLLLPQHSLLKLKQLKQSKDELKPVKENKNHTRFPIKPKPLFEDVLKSIDEIQFQRHKEKSKKSKKSIPKVVIKKTENGSHYASTSGKDEYNPDLTGRKWQPWVFLEKNSFVDKMATKHKIKAIYNHRKNTYVLAEKFKKYKSVHNTKFVITQPKSENSHTGLKYTIRLKHIY